MNQTKKRLSIIKLAISITDLETIQLQVLKLSPIKTDAKLDNILTLLREESYAQAQGLITTYIEIQSDEIIQRTAVKDDNDISAEDQQIIDEFQLFITPSESRHSKKVVEIDINDYASIEPKITKLTQNQNTAVNYDSLLQLDPDDVLKDNININITETLQKNSTQDTFFKTENTKKAEWELLDESIPKDSFFEEKELETPTETPIEELEFDKGDITDDEISESIEEKDIFNTPISDAVDTVQNYPAIPHISQKLISMKKHYPSIQKTYEKFDTVESLLTKISQEGYTEQEIEEMAGYIKKLIEKAKYTEAAQLLLVCGATESKFAQFILARELYTGSVLVKNVPEAFTLMNTLAIDDYPEALCDLGQFYENGIGTTSDTMKAEGLYKEAVNLGIKRAEKHYARLKKQNRGFFKG